MISLDENQLKLLNATVIAASVTAIVTFVSKVFELIILWRNKKKEIEFEEELEIKKEIRNYATKIIVSANEIAVGINSFFDLIDKTVAMSSGKKNLTKDEKSTKKELDLRREEKIAQININSTKIIEYLSQFQLYFSDLSDEHETVKKANELQELTVDFKKAIFNIQEDFSIEKFNGEKDQLKCLTIKLGTLIDSFSKETRKALRVYSYKLNDETLKKKCIESFKRMKKKIPISVSSLFVGIVIGLFLGVTAWAIVGAVAGKYVSIIAAVIVVSSIIIKKLKKSSTR